MGHEPKPTRDSPADRGAVRQFTPPAVESRVSRQCPRCGATAAVHGRIVRAIHDWDTTFVECLRLRCCGVTFLAAPFGLTPRARYSDRVVALARALCVMGVPLRECARLLAAARVPATAQAIRRWCSDLLAVRAAHRPTRARIRQVAAGDIAIPLGGRAWLTIETAHPEVAWSALEQEMPARRPALAQPPASPPVTPGTGTWSGGCRLVIIPCSP